jgi:hypothetical protein
MTNNIPNESQVLYGSTLRVDPQPPLEATALQAELQGTLDNLEPAPEDKRLTGERNVSDVLMWLHRFGWLSSRMIAALVWPAASQSWPMARRTLKKMLADKLVLARALPQGGDVYLLSVKGARLLQDAAGVQAKGGQSLATGNAVHRACGNWYLIGQVQAGLRIWTEHEIASGLAPIHTVNGKLFDGLVVHDDGLITACEIENAWKNRSRRQAVVEVATRHLGRDKMTPIGRDSMGRALYLARLSIVCTTVDALRSMAASFQEAHRMLTATEMCLAAVDVSVLPVSPGLVPGEAVAGNLWWDVLQPHALS